MSEISDARDEEKGLPGRLFPLLATLMAGGILGALGAQPFTMLADGAKASVMLVREQFQERPHILGPLVYEDSGLVSSDKDAMEPGHTLVQGIFADGKQVRLLDAEGQELHRWTADFFAIWPDADEVFPATQVPKSPLHYFIQGMEPLEDGSIILNFGQLGAARLDACSNLVWRSDRPTHHSVTPTMDGNYWIPGVIAPEDTPEKYLPTGMSAADIIALSGDSMSKSYNNSALLVDPQGNVLKEFSVVAAVYEAELDHALYASLTDVPADPVHLNDIEEVTPALAARIDGVEAGDILVSLREMHMLAILDKDDGHLKWHQQGPWVRQHDPDITPDGLIEIFDNRAQMVGRHVTGSRILRFDPATGETTTVNPVGEADRFNSFIVGTHQALPNGNRLIAESIAGRVFEVTPDGAIAWDYRQAYDDEAAALFADARRIPADYFAKEALTCPS